jgi:dTDP-4-dehydrorhamnose 3,5-epimerase
LSGRFEKTNTPLAGLLLLRRRVIGDARGHLSRLFDAEDMADLGWPGGVAQVNETVTLKAGTVRGFHFQRPPFAEAKLVTCIRGNILDIAVDIREGSPTFLKHYAAELSADNACSLLIPPGFAHGFQTLEDDVILIYAHSAPYRAEAEGGLNPLDPRLAIAWPQAPNSLSPRDEAHPFLDDAFAGFEP